MNNKAILGYLQFSLDGMYIDEIPLTDTQRAMLKAYMYDAFDMLTEEEAEQYYLNHSNTNIKEV